jgi:hypothetical protein
MSYTTYKLIHLLGIFSLLVALAGMAAHAAANGKKEENPAYRTLQAFHGIGALLALVGGFGLLARMEIHGGLHFPGWVWAKLVLWLLLGGLVALPYRRRDWARTLLVLLPVLGFLGAVLAVLKPF